ncbi:MAG: GGDEF domain-containing protein [Saccharofermentanales bacterium]
MRETILTIIQSYLVSVVALCIFLVFIYRSVLLRYRVKKFFFIGSAVLLACIIAESTAYIFSVPLDQGGNIAIQYIAQVSLFAIAPALSMTFTYIYGIDNKYLKNGLFFVPLVLNALLSVAYSPLGGLFTIELTNKYVQGPVFLFPYITGEFYMLAILILSLKNKEYGKRRETLFFLVVAAAVMICDSLEIFYGIQFIRWNMTVFCLIMYFLLLNIHMVLYDSLTGVYRRPVCIRALEDLRKDRLCTITMIDLNGLKGINDKYGHSEGDKAILQVVKAISAIGIKKSRIYRFGGDEFVMLSLDTPRETINQYLRTAQDRCGFVHGIQISFAYGTIEFHGGDDIHEALDQVDERMYKLKAVMKSNYL